MLTIKHVILTFRYLKIDSLFCILQIYWADLNYGLLRQRSLNWVTIVTWAVWINSRPPSTLTVVDVRDPSNERVGCVIAARKTTVLLHVVYSKNYSRKFHGWDWEDFQNDSPTHKKTLFMKPSTIQNILDENEFYLTNVTFSNRRAPKILTRFSIYELLIIIMNFFFFANHVKINRQ